MPQILFIKTTDFKKCESTCVGTFKQKALVGDSITYFVFITALTKKLRKPSIYRHSRQQRTGSGEAAARSRPVE